jgi:hypothetical protein
MAQSSAPGLALMLAVSGFFGFFAGSLKAFSKVIDALKRRPVSEHGFLYDQMLPSMALAFLGSAASALFFCFFPASWPSASPLALSLCLHALFFLAWLALLCLAVLANRGKTSARSALRLLRKPALIAMISFSLITMIAWAWLAIESAHWLSLSLFLASILAMLGMGPMGSSAFKTKVGSLNRANWIEQGVNIFSQAAYLAASVLLFF